MAAMVTVMHCKLTIIKNDGLICSGDNWTFVFKVSWLAEQSLLNPPSLFCSLYPISLLCRRNRLPWKCLRLSVKMFCTDFCPMCLCPMSRYAYYCFCFFLTYFLILCFFLHCMPPVARIVTQILLTLNLLSTRTIKSGSKDLRVQQLTAQMYSPPLYQGTLRYIQWKCNCEHRPSINWRHL